jgi:DNA topoisomerase-2
MELSKKYQKKTDRQHVLDTPDMYIGSMDMAETTDWTLDNGEIVHKSFKYIPAMYKCFDEGIVNARDHYIRMKGGDNPVRRIDITIHENVITIENDGNGIDVAKHPEHNIWIPEMIFGHLRTSTNYDKTEKKIVGGKNGYGMKLVFIFSKWGTIETVDSVRRLKYVQTFRDNLSVIEEPIITKVSAKVKPYTKVSWLLDYERFGVEGLSEDMIGLLSKRTYDVSAMTDKGVVVSLNRVPIGIKSFEHYVNMFIGDKKEKKRIYEAPNERWEYVVCLTPFDEFAHVSFVNGIYTSKGGKHVEYILNQIVRKLSAYIEEKKKVKVKPATIKEQIMIFLNCIVENPHFDSQTKDCLNTAVANFGSAATVSDAFIEKLAKMGVMESALSLTLIKGDKDAAKKTDGKKTRAIYGIPKLVDANFAGTAKSARCVLILCEGDSAKSGVISGLSKEDRDIIGVYPLRGKMLNVRGMPATRVASNKEITELKKILALGSGRTYDTDEEVATLRYGAIMILTDADVDGHHIKGLVINMFDALWPSLLKRDGFIRFMNTPILKATKGKEVLSFYQEGEFEEWKQHEDVRKWTIKYYKGLGTSSAAEFKMYFRGNRKEMKCLYSDECGQAIDMVFNKKRATDRKEWLAQYDKTRRLDYTQLTVRYDDFIHRELIHFSIYDNERSIPSLIDGLKTSLRKILYSAFKRNLVNEIKVAQFAGYVAEHSAYHHGEQSLNAAIVGMAQDFMGSNNVNLLMPVGQFGTRQCMGKDSSAERYIFTYLNPITSLIFRPEDKPVLNYLDDDGFKVEPDYYVPIIPMILINGVLGIGTGYSTNIPPFHPIKIIDNLLSSYVVDEDENIVVMEDFAPYYRGFRGSVEEIDDSHWLIRGVWTANRATVHITELPVGMATESFIEHLDELREGITMKAKKDEDLVSVASGSSDKVKKTKPIVKLVKDYKNNSTTEKIDIVVTFINEDTLDLLMDKKIHLSTTVWISQLEKTLKLTDTVATTNMVLFDAERRIKHYTNIWQIIDEYVPIRMKYYDMRKAYQIKALEYELMVLTNKARFIQEQLSGDLDLRRKKKDWVIEELTTRGYDNIDDFKYLRHMNIDSVIEENVDKLMKERDNKMRELEILRGTTTTTMWRNELLELKATLVKCGW